MKVSVTVTAMVAGAGEEEGDKEAQPLAYVMQICNLMVWTPSAHPAYRRIRCMNFELQYLYIYLRRSSDRTRKQMSSMQHLRAPPRPVWMGLQDWEVADWGHFVSIATNPEWDSNTASHITYTVLAVAISLTDW